MVHMLFTRRAGCLRRCGCLIKHQYPPVNISLFRDWAFTRKNSRFGGPTDRWRHSTGYDAFAGPLLALGGTCEEYLSAMVIVLPGYYATALHRNCLTRQRSSCVQHDDEKTPMVMNRCTVGCPCGVRKHSHYFGGS